VTLLKHAITSKRRAYVLVNNRLEGNAPLTVQALVDALQSSKGHGGSMRDDKPGIV
jgi:hypothetical protein